MPGRRSKRKNPRRRLGDDWDDDDDTDVSVVKEDEVWAENENQERAKPISQRRRIGEEMREHLDSSNEVQWPRKLRKQWLHFCCSTCGCSDEQKAKFADVPRTKMFVQTTKDCYYHRRCCHNIEEDDFETAVPLDHVGHERALIMEGKMEPPVAPKRIITSSDQVIRQYDNEKSYESRAHNASGKPDPIGVLNTNSEYLKTQKEFAEIEKRRRPAVVLDLFSGCGTSLVVLKRLKIKISKYVSCEQDKVASHVSREHHDPRYSDSPNVQKMKNFMEYVHFENFEHLETDDGFEELMAHAPFDILISSPPCVDFSAINANRQGLQGGQGSYMLRLGRVMKRIKKHVKQRGVRFHFLVENVAIKDDENKELSDGDLQQIQRALGVSWNVELDACDFSPTRRNRYFFCNFPLEQYNFAKSINNPFPPHWCLNLDDEKEFKLPGSVVEGKERIRSERMKTFMASKSRLDDDRMKVYRRKHMKGKVVYEVRHISVSERAAAMGYPDNYFKPVEILFDKLSEVLIDPYHRAGEDGQNFSRHWKKTLDQKLHVFQGAYHGIIDAYRVELTHYVGAEHIPGSPPRREFDLKMCPPSGRREHLTFLEYQKRLIGNAYSVPVAEHILASLRELFEEHWYDAFIYDWKWGHSKWQGPECEERRRFVDWLQNNPGWQDETEPKQSEESADENTENVAENDEAVDVIADRDKAAEGETVGLEGKTSAVVLGVSDRNPFSAKGGLENSEEETLKKPRVEDE